MSGIEQPSQLNDDLVRMLKAKRAKKRSVREYIDGIYAGNRTVLSQAITLVESSRPEDQEAAGEIIEGCMRGNGNNKEGNRQKAMRESYRIGITGVPGVGKSTFIEALGKFLTGQGHKLAVLAIDPSSSRSKGSILGDKTRMEELANDPNAFIRPSPSAGSLGGVARKTRETVILCEAAGFDVIFIETVGVGQSETAVHSMTDFFLLLMLAAAGDELQGIKRGIIEMADAIFINKADGENIAKARHAQAEYSHALHLFPPSESGWIPVTGICSAVSKMGIETVWKTILDHREKTSATGFFTKKRQDQSQQVLHETIEAELGRRFYSDKEMVRLLHSLEKEIATGLCNPYKAAQILLDKYFNRKIV